MKLVFFGGSFNPPTCAHRAIVRYLLSRSDVERLIVKPCGFRSDKPELDTSPERAEAIFKELHFSDTRFELDLSGLNKAMIPTAKELEILHQQYPNADIWLAVGEDLFIEEKEGQVQIETWVQGKRLFNEAQFLIFPRPCKGKRRFAPKHEMLSDFTPIAISSSELREKRKQEK